MIDSQFQGVGAIKTRRKNGNTFDFHCEHGLVRVTVLSDGIVRVRATKSNDFGPDFSYAIARTKWPKVKTAVRNSKAITISTKKLLVTVTKRPLRIEFARADGTVLAGDQP